MTNMAMINNPYVPRISINNTSSSSPSTRRRNNDVRRITGLIALLFLFIEVVNQCLLDDNIPHRPDGSYATRDTSILRRNLRSMAALILDTNERNYALKDSDILLQAQLDREEKAGVVWVGPGGMVILDGAEVEGEVEEGEEPEEEREEGREEVEGEESRDENDEQPQQQQLVQQWPPKYIVDAHADSMKRVVVISVNCGFIDMADNYLNSIVKLGVTNFVVVPMDTVTYQVMSKAYPGHVTPIVPELKGVEHQSTSSYNTEGFRILTSIRPTFLLHFLESGYSIFYNDVDMVWTRNLFENLMELNQEKALLVWGKGGKFGDGANTSTIFMKPTTANLNFVRAWKQEMDTGAHKNDQFGFNAILNTRAEGKEMPKIWGDGEKFPHAMNYFNTKGWNRDAAHVIHNNVLSSKGEKIKRFKKHGMWELSGKLSEYQCEKMVDKNIKK